MSPYYDVVLPVSALQAGLGAVQAEVTAAGFAGGIAGVVTGAIAQCWSGILMHDIQARQVDGRVCLRLKWHKVAWLHVGPTPEIGRPDTAYYAPSGGADPNSAP
jgi:hypothetical protein